MSDFRTLLIRELGKAMGLPDAEIEDVLANPADTREKLVNQLWANVRKHQKVDFKATPVFVCRSPFDNDSVTFERVTYGNSVVIEAEGIIVERLCGDAGQ